jgi:hypothetical protein
MSWENIGTKEVVRRSSRYQREWERRNVQCKSNETLPMKNKSKCPRKEGGIQGTNGKDPSPRRQKNHLRAQTTRRTSSSQNTLLLKPLSQEAYQIRKGEDLLKGCLA